MQKIPSVFQRNYDGDRLVRDEIVEGCAWVLRGEGKPTRKYDGTACMVKDGILYKRYDVKKGRLEPPGFIPAQDPDPATGHWPGWIQVEPAAKENRWHAEAMARKSYPDGTYELCGPKVQGNPERLDGHYLVPHGQEVIPVTDHSFEGIRSVLEMLDIEGIVWHHPDGRMAKIKKKDFEMKRTAAWLRPAWHRRSHRESQPV